MIETMQEIHVETLKQGLIVARNNLRQKHVGPMYNKRSCKIMKE